MKLTNNKGESFELKIVGYQFPEKNKPERYDDWLMVQTKIKLPQGNCESVDPCLLVEELIRLRNWLSNFGKEGTRTNLEFIEPTLKFELINHNATLRVTLSDSIRYVDHVRKKSDRKIQLQFELDFDFHIEKASVLASSLTAQLESFPSRITS